MIRGQSFELCADTTSALRKQNLTREKPTATDGLATARVGHGVINGQGGFEKAMPSRKASIGEFGGQRGESDCPSFRSVIRVAVDSCNCVLEVCNYPSTLCWH